MLEIKVQCDCGQRYKFDVEPVDGRMPFTVNCPICGSSGTEKANEILQGMARQNLAALNVASPAFAGVATAAPVLTQTQRPPPGPPRLRINATRHEPPAAETNVAVAPEPPAPRPMMRPQAAEAPATKAIPGKKPNFAMGLLGAVIGSVVGSLIYYLVFKSAGFQAQFLGVGAGLKLLAIGVGYLSGLGAELLGRKEGSKELGVIAAVFTLMGIVGSQYLVARSWWHGGTDLEPGSKSAYEESVSEAKKIVKAVPTGSDQEIKLYLAKEEASDSGEKIDPKSITQDEIKNFRETTLPEMQNLASGKTSKAEFEKQNNIDEAKDKKERDSEEGTFKAVFLLLLLSRINLISLCAAAGLAFKVSSNA